MNRDKSLAARLPEVARQLHPTRHPLGLSSEVRDPKDVTTGRLLAALRQVGYRFVSGATTPRSARFTYVCKEGHTREMLVDNFIQGKRCPDCANESRGRSHLKDIGQVRDRFAREGYTLHSATYEGKKQKLACVCPFGHPWNVSWDSFCAKGTRCSKCKWTAKTLSWETATAPILVAGYKILEGRDSYRNVHSRVVVQCPEDHKPYPVQVYNFRNGRRCPGCSVRQSAGELVLTEFFESFATDVVRGTKQLLGNQLELDAYSASLRLALEFNGLYFHSEEAGKSPEYHAEKLAAAARQGIRLIQVFEDEWNHRRPAVEALISRAARHAEPVDAAELTLATADLEMCQAFLEGHHPLGRGPETVEAAWCLNSPMGPMQLLSVTRTPSGRFAVHRLATRNGNLVAEGAARLLGAAQTWAKEKGDATIEVRVDRRLFTGDEWFELGFEFIELTAPRRWLTDNHIRVAETAIELHGRLRTIRGHIHDCGELVLRRSPLEPHAKLQPEHWQRYAASLPPAVAWVALGRPTRRVLNLKKRSEVCRFIAADGYKIVSGIEKYRNTQSRLTLLCGVGDHPAYEVKVGNFLAGKRCPLCGRAKAAEARRTPVERVRAALAAEGYMLLSDLYVSGKGHLRARCPRGHVRDFRYDNWKTGYRCFDCVDRFFLRRPKEEMLQPIREAGYTLLAGEDTYQSVDSRVTVQCQLKHRPYSVMVKKFRVGRRCPTCARMKGPNAS